MKAEDQNMDEQFRKAASESNFSYRAEFWNEVESQLGDDSMDNAFRSAAGNLVVAPSFSFEDDMADAYLDEAFSSAATNYAIDYNTAHWQDFLQKEAILEQDVAFNLAANSITADYHSAYWSDADIALQNEGLHYEYQTAYWNEARQLLDRADRGVFFMRWSAVAAILLLLSIGGLYRFDNVDSSEQMQFASAKIKSNNKLVFAAEAFRSNETSNVNNFPNHDEIGFVKNGLSSLPSNDFSAHSSVENVRSDERNLTKELNSQSSEGELGLSSNDQTYDAGSDLEIAESVLATAGTNDVENLATNSADVTIKNEDPLAAEMESDLGFSFVRNLPAITSEPEMDSAPNVEIKKLEIPATHQVSFIANAGVGNRYSKVDFIPSLRTSFGIEYMRRGYGRFPNLEFGASLNLSHTRQNDFGTERRVSVFNTDGGIDKFWYKLQLKDMIYASVSGVSAYRLSPKQNLRLSFGVDYLMFVQSNMSYQIEADKGITTINNNWGVKDGLSKFDLRMGFGYEYQFTHRFAGQVNGNLGFFDRTDDQFIEKSFFDQEISVTVGFKYTFLRKS